MADINKLTGGVKDPARAAALGLTPEGDGQVSERGEFIVNPDNVTALEDKKMRGYRAGAHEYPKALHGWGKDPNNPEAPDGPVDLVVNTREEEVAAVKEGWSVAAVLCAPAPKAETSETESIWSARFADLSAKDAVAVVEGADVTQDDLDVMEAEENAGKKRKGVLAAIADRREALKA